MSPEIADVAPGVLSFRDTCTVYAIRSPRPGPDGERTGVLIDFGSGAVLDHLEQLGLDRITHVLMTHHHRDQGQGLHRAREAGIRILVPPLERDLFEDVETFWQQRRLRNDYQMLTDRFSLLTSVPVDDSAPEYRTVDADGVELLVQPTPGHTPGSVSYLLDREGTRIAFSGDLIHSPGKVTSLLSTQWTYTGQEGAMMTMLSCLVLKRRAPDLLLPSHGHPMSAAADALDELLENLREYVDHSRPSGTTEVFDRFEEPFVALSEHLLLNRSAESCSYVLLSETGAALLLDYGYDMTTWFPLGGPRWSQRPWLESIPALKERHGVSRVEVALPTHYHDDHCAGMNLLREVEGTQLWIPENVAPTMADPMQRDLPCQWFEPIPADRVLPLGEAFTWHEYTITPHPLPGHTLYAAAFSFEVDGMQVLATGDQTDGGFSPGTRREGFNYQYRNLFRHTDYRDSAALLRELAPGLLVTGHWGARGTDAAYFEALTAGGEQIVDLHERLLPLEEFPTAADTRPARILPYARHADPGEELRFAVEVDNPTADRVEVRIHLVSTPGLEVDPAATAASCAPGESVSLPVTGRLRPDADPGRQLLAADVHVGDLHLGQIAEAVVDPKGRSIG